MESFWFVYAVALGMFWYQNTYNNPACAPFQTKESCFNDTDHAVCKCMWCSNQCKITSKFSSIPEACEVASSSCYNKMSETYSMGFFVALANISLALTLYFAFNISFIDEMNAQNARPGKFIRKWIIFTRHYIPFFLNNNKRSMVEDAKQVRIWLNRFALAMSIGFLSYTAKTLIDSILLFMENL